MATIRRLADSCLVLSTDHHRTLVDPGMWTYDSGVIDLDTIGDITRVLITHEHADHVKPEFVRWLLDRRRDLTVHGNQAVADLLASHGIDVDTADPDGVGSEDVIHETTPLGTAPPNRSYTVEDVLTHPGDSYQPTITAPVLALPMIVLWGSTTASVAFARRLRPRYVVPIHDFYLSESGRRFIAGVVRQALASDGIEVFPLDWDESTEV